MKEYNPEIFYGSERMFCAAVKEFIRLCDENGLDENTLINELVEQCLNEAGKR